MKQLFFTLLALMLIASPALAAEQRSIHEAGTGIDNPKIKEDGQGTGQAVGSVNMDNDTEDDAEDIVINNKIKDEPSVEPTEKTVELNEKTVSIDMEEKILEENIAVQRKARNTEELKQMVQETKQIMTRELETLKTEAREVYQNQNTVREAVRSMIAMEDLVGGIGEQISQIAQEFDNSVQATIKAEEKIKTRSRFMKFFAGGDDKAANIIEEKVKQNKIKIEELQQLQENCGECDEQIRELLQEQVQNMEQEQERLGRVAEAEKKVQSVWSWIKGLFAK